MTPLIQIHNPVTHYEYMKKSPYLVTKAYCKPLSVAKDTDKIILHIRFNDIVCVAQITKENKIRYVMQIKYSEIQNTFYLMYDEYAELVRMIEQDTDTVVLGRLDKCL